jgi:hypothetical protein
LHLAITRKRANAFDEGMAMSTRVENFNRTNNSAERNGVVMCKLKVRSGLVLGLLVFSIASMLPATAAGQTVPAIPRPGTDSPRPSGDRPEREQYDSRAFPEADIAPAQQKAAYNAFLSISQLQAGTEREWEGIGPTAPFVPGVLTFSGRSTYTSGRVTSLALSPTCHAGNCRIFVGAAGGGIWTASNALASHLDWHPSSSGIPSNAIGSVIFDPTDPSGKTLYVGTGEPNGSGDSEAGVGLYKSTNLGQSWTLVAGSLAVAQGRSIAQVAVDPVDPKHIFIGTAVARHGISSVAGGRFTPPGAPQVGLYESADGGTTFTLAFSRPSDVVNPNTANGSDFFRGGVTNVVFDRTGLSGNDASRVYLSIFDYGVYRSDGTGGYEQIFASAGGGGVAGSPGSRTEFALAPNGEALRIYVGDTDGSPADLYRVDNALVPAATLTDGTMNPGWTKLSNSTPGTPGFASYDFCGNISQGIEQCWYDMVVASPPGHPDTVWILGSMQYSEILPNTISNGRAVQRSIDAGVSFTDMSNDTQSPPLGMHPDQHAIVFVPGRPDIAIIGSDGGVVRTSGAFADASATCDTRGLTDPHLSQCHQWLSAVPTQIFSLNNGLATLQFQSLSINSKNPLGDIMGGTQDNGTWAFKGEEDGEEGSWFESIFGDGGQSGVDIANPNVRMHMYTGPFGDVNFHGTDPLSWDYFGDPLVNSGEAFSFYAPLISDPSVSGTWFIGGGHVWRTLDNAGPETYLRQNCSTFLAVTLVPCGDWEALGGTAGNLISGPATAKGTGYVVAIVRAPNDTGTLWVGTRRGRVWLSKNADAASPSVTYLRVDTPSQPRRFVSGIAVDPVNPNHAWISFSGYEAYTPTTPGHVFEVTVHDDGSAVWSDLSSNLGDQPITAIARDDVTGDLFVSTDFGVDALPSGSTTWVPAGSNLPPVAVYGLTINSGARVLYAATHGRSAWKLKLDSSE